MKVVCTVLDVRAGYFAVPFYSHSVVTAKRDFEAAGRDSSSYISKFPDDYDLWLLGRWDEDSGKFDLLENPEVLLRGRDLFKED